GRPRGAPVLREAGNERGRELHRVHQLPLRRTGMHAVTFDPHTHLGRGEVLVVDPTDLRSVERVREVRAERLDVEMVDATADLLVDREADLDRRVLDLRMTREIRDGAHDLRHTGLVFVAEP